MGELVTLDIFRKKRFGYDLEKLFNGSDTIINYDGVKIKEKFLTMYDGTEITYQELMEKLVTYVDIIKDNNLQTHYHEIEMVENFYENLHMQLIMMSELDEK